MRLICFWTLWHPGDNAYKETKWENVQNKGGIMRTKLQQAIVGIQRSRRGHLNQGSWQNRHYGEHFALFLCTSLSGNLLHTYINAYNNKSCLVAQRPLGPCQKSGGHFILSGLFVNFFAYTGFNCIFGWEFATTCHAGLVSIRKPEWGIEWKGVWWNEDASG